MLSASEALMLVQAAIYHAEARTRLSGFKTDDIGTPAKPPKKVEITQERARELCRFLAALQGDGGDRG